MAVRSRAFRAFGAWLLALTLLPSLAFAANWQMQPGAETAQADHDLASEWYSGTAAGDGEVRQCLPDSATCDDVPAASVAAIVGLAGDVVAAVASEAWTEVMPPAPLTSRDIPPRVDPEPPRTS